MRGGLCVYMANPSPQLIYDKWGCYYGLVRDLLQYCAFASTTPARYAPSAPVRAFYDVYFGEDGERQYLYDLRAQGLREEEIEIDGVLIQAIDCRGSPATVVQTMLETLGLPSQDLCKCPDYFWRYQANTPCGS